MAIGEAPKSYNVFFPVRIYKNRYSDSSTVENVSLTSRYTAKGSTVPRNLHSISELAKAFAPLTAQGTGNLTYRSTGTIIDTNYPWDSGSAPNVYPTEADITILRLQMRSTDGVKELTYKGVYRKAVTTERVKTLANAIIDNYAVFKYEFYALVAAELVEIDTIDITP